MEATWRIWAVHRRLDEGLSEANQQQAGLGGANQHSSASQDSTRPIRTIHRTRRTNQHSSGLGEANQHSSGLSEANIHTAQGPARPISTARDSVRPISAEEDSVGPIRTGVH